MVESLDAYRLANYLRGCDPNICTIDDVLTRYCEPMPLTQECFPIFMLKTTGPDDSCIFLKDGLLFKAITISVYSLNRIDI